MPRNGSGGYSPPAGQPVVSGTAISSTVFNALVADLGNELTKSICTDGQTPMTANLPMGANRITNLGAAVAAGDAVRLDQVTGYLPLTGGTLSGGLRMINGIGATINDSTGTARLVFAMGPDNQINYSVAGGNSLSIYNQALTTNLWNIDNSGLVKQVNNLVFNNTRGIFFNGSGDAAAFQYAYMGSDNNVYNRVSGGNNILYLSQTGTQIASLSNNGIFSAITITQTSDERKKKLWQRMPKGFVSQLAKLRKSGLFTWRKGGAIGIGVGAQSFERIFPAAVHTDEKGNKSVNYGAAALVSCVELAVELEALKAEFAKLVKK